MNRVVTSIRGGLMIALAAVTAACGTDDRPLRFLEALPEYGLAHPQAQLISSSGSPEQASIEGPNPATTSHVYEAPSSEEEIVAWYESELTATDWRSDGKDGNDFHRWSKPFVGMRLRFQQPSGDGVRYEVTLSTQRSWYDPAPLAALEAVPELAIADPSASPRNDGFQRGRSVGERQVTPASIERSYATVASAAEVIAFFESELARRGWAPLDPPPGDLGVGLEPDRVWRKDDLVAGLSIFPKRPSPATIGYGFKIAEVTDAEPGLPWQ